MSEQKKPQRRLGPRRASRPAVAGADPHPSDHALTSRAAEDLPERSGENGERSDGNDARLKQDKPPHWG